MSRCFGSMIIMAFLLSMQFSTTILGGSKIKKACKGLVKRSKDFSAELPDGSLVLPNDYFGGYHGTHLVRPDVALKKGLPAKGKNINLLKHVEAKGKSAFRGVTHMVTDMQSESGAAYWAGKGGFVYDIRGVPTWDVTLLLEGRVFNGLEYRGNLMSGENERAIPARVPPNFIKRWGKVKVLPSGLLVVKKWHDNPGFKITREN